METKQLNFSGRELPAYLGYGILDENSVRFANEVITADYVLSGDGTVVHKVIWDKNRCELQTHLHGESYGTSWYPDLHKALTYDFFSRHFDSDKVYDYLTKRTCDAGNIYVQKFKPASKDEKRIVYYPAGILLSFNLPLPEKDELYMSFLESIKGSHISLFREKSSHLLLLDVHEQVTMHPITVAEFIVPLAYMTDAAETFTKSGLIRPCKILRMMVDESYKTQSSFMQTFTGDDVNPYFAYCFKELDEGQHGNLMKMFEHTAKALSFQTPNKE
jgi:hypothetical protein